MPALAEPVYDERIVECSIVRLVDIGTRQGILEVRWLSCIIDVDRSMHLKIGFHQLQTAGMTPLDRDTGLGQRKHHRIWGMAEQYFRQRQLLGNLMDVEIDPVIRCTHDRENGGDVDGGKSDLRV